MIAGAEAGVWTERMLSALANGVKGGKWFSLMDKVFAPKTLALAWMKVRANKGAAGVDGQSIERFAAKAELYLSELSAALKDGSYRPEAVKRVDIPKGDGKTRPLGIPTVKDRVVQQAVRLVIEPIFEQGFADGSYGFRPGRGCHDALREVDGLIKAGCQRRSDFPSAGRRCARHGHWIGGGSPSRGELVATVSRRQLHAEQPVVRRVAWRREAVWGRSPRRTAAPNVRELLSRPFQPGKRAFERDAQSPTEAEAVRGAAAAEHPVSLPGEIWVGPHRAR